MKIASKHFLLVMLVVIAGFCRCSSKSIGGTEAGNPPTRLVQGSIPASADPDDGCVADAVTAADVNSDYVVTGSVSEDCTFELELETGRTYQFSFEKDDAFVAHMVFTDSDSLQTNSFLLSAADSILNFGNILFNGQTATPENEPAAQNDEDGDGTPDSEDLDSDGDGTLDLLELDCDLDGIADDLDSDLSTCVEDVIDDTEVLLTRILEVFPHNLSGISNILTAVSINAPIQARFDCEVDPATVNSTTFSVVNSLNQAVACTYAYSSNNRVVTCNHPSNFLNLTVYTATVEGVACVDAEPIGETAWSFRTIGLELF